LPTTQPAGSRSFSSTTRRIFMRSPAAGQH
jgi:hypothetical protein